MSHEVMNKIVKDAAEMRTLRALLQGGEVVLRPQHKHGCCTYFTAIHPCDCGALERYQEVKLLIYGKKEKTHEGEE